MSECLSVYDLPEVVTPLYYMIFTFQSHSPDAVRECLMEAGLFDPLLDTYAIERSHVTVCYQDDSKVRELQVWESAAVGACLITRSHIEH